MRQSASAARYGAWSIALHWLMLALLIGVYACIELRVFFPKGSDMREGLKAWHFMVGLTVLALVWLRLAIRFARSAPPIVPKPAAWEYNSARLMHAALYALMIGMPVLGWLLLSANGKPVPFFGLELPPLIGADKEFGKLLEEIHETGGTVGYYLIGLHSAAALFHHYVRLDDTLLRMLPGPGFGFLRR